MATEPEREQVQIAVEGQRVEAYLEQQRQRALSAGAKHDFYQQSAAAAIQVANIRRGRLGRLGDTLYRPQETANSRTRHLSLANKVNLYGEDVMEIKALNKVLEEVDSEQRLSLEQVQQRLRQRLGQKAPKGGALRRAIIALAQRGTIVLWASATGTAQLDPEKITPRTSIYLQGRRVAAAAKTAPKPAAPTREILLSALAELGPEPVPFKALLNLARQKSGRLLAREWAGKQVRMLAEIGEVERLAASGRGEYVPYSSENRRIPVFVRLTESGCAVVRALGQREAAAAAAAPTQTQLLLELVLQAGEPTSMETLRAELRKRTGNPCYPSWMRQSAAVLERASQVERRARIGQQLVPLGQAPEDAELYLLPAGIHPEVIELGAAEGPAAEVPAAEVPAAEVPAAEVPAAPGSGTLAAATEGEPQALAALEVAELARRLKELGVRRFSLDLEF